MYLLLIGLLLGTGLLVARHGVAHERKALTWLGSALVVATVALFALLELWAEGLWFHAAGFGARFWTFLLAETGMLAVGALAAAVLALALNLPLRRLQPVYFLTAVLVTAAGGALWGLGAWEHTLLFVHRVEAGIAEPVLGIDAGFYLFTLPFLNTVHNLLIWIVAVAAVAAVAVTLLRGGSAREREEDAVAVTNPLAVASLAAGVVVALGAVLAVFQLLYSQWGVVSGPGWTDEHVRLPGYLVIAAATLLLAGLPMVTPVRRALIERLHRVAPERPPSLIAPAVAWVGVFAVWILVGGIVPSTFQWLLVEPNEISYEREYIANNIAMTRHGFGLDRIEEKRYPADADFTRRTIARNQHLLSEIRLWDWRALDAVYQQFQEIRLYYEFVDVDVDRYHVGDEYRQVMVSARELSQDNLPAQSKTFVNRRFKYTHGYGLTLAPVSDFTAEGLPNLLVKDIPPQSTHPSLEVERPEIYYGELTDEPVIVNTSEPEFDYPSGEENVYVRYAGNGGVEMRNLWRKFLFGWKFDGTRLLFSSYPEADSRMMFHRQIRDRIRTLAPFLTLDEDPYLVLAEGRLYWVVDAYTTSRAFPYSQPFDAFAAGEWRGVRGAQGDGAPGVGYLHGINYLRNAVKVVVDAYHGDVDFYVFEPDEPVIRAWRNVLPGMFADRDDMPEALETHIRYPQGLLLTQGLVYAKYHMGDPDVFYNQEDLWVRATEKHYGRVQPVEPYYVMWELPESDEAEFVLMLPFTPKNRQVMIGWIAGLSDGENYGRFLAYKFPKERRVIGPQQVESKIDQDSYLSAQLSLWDQRGSNVIRGNVLAIPLDDTLLYVEPIYLRAETAAYPELRLVVVMHDDNMSYAPGFDEALEGLFAGQAAQPGALPATLRESAAQADAAFDRYLQAQGEGRFGDAAKALEELQDLLSSMATKRGAPAPNPAIP